MARALEDVSDIEPVRAPAPVGRARGGRAGIASIYVLLGAVLALVGRRVPGDDVTLSFGLGDEAPALMLDPPSALVAFGVLLAACGLAGLVLGRRSRRAAGSVLLVGTLLLIPIALIASLGLSSGLKSTNLVPLVVESLRLGTPVALGALAGLWCERSGVVNIGIEGMMLAGAGVGFVVYALLNGAQGGWPLYASVVVAVVVGGLMATLHAVVCVTFRTDQIISGVVINLLAIGLTTYLRTQVLVPRAITSGRGLGDIRLPVLSELPIVGPLFVGRPIYLTMFVLFAITWIVLQRTPWGLRVRSVGENPHAAETLGVDVIKTRYQAVILGGCIAGLGGAWFSLEGSARFNDLITDGTGFIALAALIFGKWRAWPAFGGAMLFGFANALGTRVQFLEVEVGSFPLPSQFLQLLPYAVTIVVLAGAIGRAIPPAAVGRPFERSH